MNFHLLRKSRGLVCIVGIVIAIFASSLFVACDPNEGTSSTWTFQNSAYGHEKIEVTIKDGGSPSSFTFYPGESVKVTWEDKGGSYRGGYSWKATAKSTYSGKGAYVQEYSSTKVVQFLSY